MEHRGLGIVRAVWFVTNRIRVTPVMPILVPSPTRRGGIEVTASVVIRARAQEPGVLFAMRPISVRTPIHTWPGGVISIVTAAILERPKLNNVEFAMKVAPRLRIIRIRIVADGGNSIAPVAIPVHQMPSSARYVMEVL